MPSSGLCSAATFPFRRRGISLSIGVSSESIGGCASLESSFAPYISCGFCRCGGIIVGIRDAEEASEAVDSESVMEGTELIVEDDDGTAASLAVADCLCCCCSGRGWSWVGRGLEAGGATGEASGGVGSVGRDMISSGVE